MKRFKILPSPLGEGVRRTEGVISEKQRSRGQEGFLEVRKLGGQEGKLFNDSSLNNILLKPQNDKVLSPYSPIALSPSNKKAAFTLAEVMIVVAIIGVVAALVMPSFIQNMSERINSHRQANIAQKITKSVELMVANGDYQEISNTEEFVNKLSKYLKISKICDSEHLTDCWPTKRVKTTLGEYYNVEDAKTAADLHVGKDNNTPNVGLVLADGASLIMTFNPKASPITFESGFTSSSKDLPIGDKKTQNFAYTSNATAAIDFVMDVNGKTGPNQEYNSKTKEYYDIRSFKAAVFDGCAGARIPSIGCIVTGLGNANWYNARSTCTNLGMDLPDLATLKLLYSKKNIYSDIPQSGSYWALDNSTNNAWYWNFSNNYGDGGTGKSFGVPFFCYSD